MPWVQIHLGKKLEKQQQESLKSGIAGFMQEILDKEEQGLSVTFVASDGFYRAGSAVDNAAMVDVRYIGTFPLEKKQEVTRRFCRILSEKAGVDPAKVSVLFGEYDSGNWGRRQGDFS